MRLVVVVGALNLTWRWSLNPEYWQLLKGLHESGAELIVIPWAGDAMATPWWHSMSNPDRSLFAGNGPSATFRIVGSAKALVSAKKKGSSSPSSAKGNESATVPGALVQGAARLYLAARSVGLKSSWSKLFNRISHDFREIDAVMFWGVPLNELKGLPQLARRILEAPVVYYLLEPEEFSTTHRSSGQHYLPASSIIGEFDLVLTMSRGSLPYLNEVGVPRVEVVHLGVDPEAYVPIRVPQEIDVSFYGHSEVGREDRINYMVTQPSMALPSRRFVVAGENFRISMGRARFIGSFPVSFAREFYCRSKVNLNITRRSVAQIYGTSNLRLFELGALGCCIVSDSRLGLEEWFKLGDDLVVVKDSKEAIETYKWLLASEEDRLRLGESARARVMSNHTVTQRAEQILAILNRLSNRSETKGLR